MIDGRIYLFGTFQLIPGEAVTGTSLEIGSSKLQGLLAYLVLHQQEPLSRYKLAGVLWPEADPAAARRNLREYLYRARHLLAAFRPGTPFIDTEGNFITCTLPDTCWIDLVEFERLAAQIRSASALLPTDQLIAWLRQVSDLYRGNLLANLYDDWLTVERERLRSLFSDNLARLSQVLQATGHLAEAISVTQRLLEHDPLREEDHRRLMELYYANGDRARALQQYQRCGQLLAEELAAEPMPETQALYQALLNLAAADGPPAPPAADGPMAIPRGAGPFVGRQAELARLTLARTDSRTGPAKISLITGDSGLGKTRLVTEWLAALPRETIILRGQGHEFEQDIPYRPLLDALHPWLPRLPWSNLPPASTYTWLAPLAQLLPDLYYYLPGLAQFQPENEEETRHYIMEGLSQLILSFARQWPVVLFIDDLHWTGVPTWRFLDFLARRAWPTPVFIIGTFTTAEASREQRRHLRALEQGGVAGLLPLSRLGPADTAHLVSEMLGSPPEKMRPFIQRLHEEAEGYPFILIETIKVLTESGLTPPYQPGHLAQLPLPPAIQSVIESRLDRLPPGSQQALAVAAVIGRAFDLSLLAAVNNTADNDLLDYLEDWLARGLVVEQAHGFYDFSQPRIRQVVYANLSRARRRYIHCQVARALAGVQPVDVERAAYHDSLGDQPAWLCPAW